MLGDDKQIKENKKNKAGQGQGDWDGCWKGAIISYKMVREDFSN